MGLIRVGDTSSVEKVRQTSNSAGCYLLKKIKGNKFQIFIIHEKWPHGKETYVLPKGHKEFGESLDETAKRETIEESGYCDFNIVNYIGSQTYEINGKEIWIKTDHYYLAILNTDKKVEQQLEEYEKKIMVESFWIDFEEGLKLLTYENIPEFRKIILNILKLNF